MRLVIQLSKATQRVRPHLRQGHPVAGYSRHGKDTKALFERHYKLIDGWVSSAVRQLLRTADNFGAPDDAYQAGAQAAFQALRTYDPQKGKLDNYIRRSINIALSKYLHEERSRGLVGIRALRDRLRVAASESERENIRREFPRVEEFQEASTPSIEDAMEGASELFKREEYLATVGVEMAVNLRRLKAYLADKEREKKTWKMKRLAGRKLKVFELHHREGLSFRQIGNVLGIDSKEAHRDFAQIMSWLEEAKGRLIFMKKSAMETQLRRWRVLRLAFCLKRLEVALNEGFPSAYVEFIENVAVELIMRLTEDSPAD